MNLDVKDREHAENPNALDSLDSKTVREKPVGKKKANEMVNPDPRQTPSPLQHIFMAPSPSGISGLRKTSSPASESSR